MKTTNLKASSKPAAVAPSSGNVFEDVGVTKPAVALAKATLVQRIRRLIEQRKLTQAEAAKLLRIDQPKVSALFRGQVDGYSLDRLIRFLNALDQQIEIRVRPVTKGQESNVVVR